ncbi:MAG TPA: DnaT-like ssDNA-binding domain-containing protein [Hyphomicrobiales bacterium]|nr:DnaT-like ssDNA-binding domain-containing protein [Hyphomicrobiales bacterium]
MSSSLIPERPLLISPTLAATIGLDEAVLLHVISELLLQHPPLHRGQRRWMEISQQHLRDALPFWDLPKIFSVQQSLREKGLLLIEAVPGSAQTQLLAINQVVHGVPAAPAAQPPPRFDTAGTRTPGRDGAPPQSTPQGTSRLIPPDWRPDNDLLLLCQQRNVPVTFVEQEIAPFIKYQQDRRRFSYSWHNAFLKWVVAAWEKQRSHNQARHQEVPMTQGWQPSEEVLDILELAGISLGFIEDAVPEFVLYWSSQGATSNVWDSKFLAHVKRQWERYTHALEHDTTLRPIPVDFQPSPACWEILEMAQIDPSYAEALLPEFILYWRDRNEIHASWNTKFLQHVKYRWAQQLQAPQGNVLDKMTDRSWAE